MSWRSLWASRVVVVLVLLPLGLTAIVVGGAFYVLLIAVLLGLAAVEYVYLMGAGGFKPAGFLVLVGTLVLVLARAWNGFDSDPLILSAAVLGAMAWHLLAYERGRDRAAVDFSLTLTGILYLGWIGAYFISLYQLPHGMWWTLVVLPAIWLADVSAFFVGSRFGQRRLCPRLSPKKSWEGYLAGVVTAALLTPLLTLLWRALGSDPLISPAAGAGIGLLVGIIAPLGDLGESMFKRMVGAKDSGHLFLGHGGAFDRMDSWLWAVVLGYHLIVLVFI